MSLIQQIADAVVLELGRHRDELERDRHLVQIKVTIKLEPGTRAINAVSLNRESERSWKESLS